MNSRGLAPKRSLPELSKRFFQVFFRRKKAGFLFPRFFFCKKKKLLATSRRNQTGPPLQVQFGTTNNASQTIKMVLFRGFFDFTGFAVDFQPIAGLNLINPRDLDNAGQMVFPGHNRGVGKGSTGLGHNRFGL